MNTHIFICYENERIEFMKIEREFRSCKKYRILNRGLFTTFFMLIFVKFYVFIYRILLYSAI